MRICVDNFAFTISGTSRDFAAEASMTKGVGTPSTTLFYLLLSNYFLVFMAPEVISSNNYTSKADVYSFALVIYEVVSEIEPFSTGGFETAWSAWQYVFQFTYLSQKLPILLQKEIGS